MGPPIPVSEAGGPVGVGGTFACLFDAEFTYIGSGATRLNPTPLSEEMDMSEKQMSTKPESATPVVTKKQCSAPPAGGELDDQQLAKVAGGVRGPGTQTEDDIYVGRSARRS